MDLIQGKSEWVILSCETESMLESLLQRLEGVGVRPERLTLIRVEREPTDRTWNLTTPILPHRGQDRSAHLPSIVIETWRWHSILWGLISALTGLPIIMMIRLALGLGRLPTVSLLLLIMLLFLGGSLGPIILTASRRKGQPDQKTSGLIEERTKERVEPLLIGMKIALNEIDQVNKIAGEVISRRI